MIEHYLSLAVKSVFVENILLAYFLGLCPFLAVSKRIEPAVGLGLAVTFVLTISAPMNWLVYRYFLQPGALQWTGLPNVDLSFLNYVIFIATIAMLVQIVEMIVCRYSPALQQNLGIFLPLIAVNCAILGVSLLMVERGLTLVESTVFGFGAGLGWFLAIAAMAAIRWKLRYSDVPVSLQGVGISLIVTGLLAMLFMAFSGINM
ncbi:MAG: NADH:ubiquinone reductase (Na(+)-transporting) subunit E [Fidelibacterota bacterium]